RAPARDDPYDADRESTARPGAGGQGPRAGLGGLRGGARGVGDHGSAGRSDGAVGWRLCAARGTVDLASGGGRDRAAVRRRRGLLSARPMDRPRRPLRLCGARPRPRHAPAEAEGRVKYALNAEWTKLRTLAGTAWLLLGTIALTIAVGALTANATTCSAAGCT